MPATAPGEDAPPAARPGHTAAPAPGRPRAVATAVAALALAVAAGFVPGRDAVLTLALDGGEPVLPPGTLSWDLLFIACYGGALWLGSAAVRWVARTPRATRAAWFARVAAVVAVAGGVVQDALLFTAVRRPEAAPWALPGATATAVTWLAAVFAGGVVAIGGTGVLMWRAATHSRGALGDRRDLGTETVAPRPMEQDDAAAPHGAPADAAARWAAGYVVPGADPDRVNERWARGEHTTGVCLSGGGIRAACVSLGALQSLRDELLSSDHLVAVSGGAFTAGALQQALTAAPPPGDVGGEVLREPGAVYDEGSAELDHVRRHSSYLGNTPAQLLGALGRLARGLLLSLTVLFGPAVVLGVVTGWLYRHVPITDLTLDPLRYPQPRTGALVAVGVLGTAAFLLALFARGDWRERRRSARVVPPLVTLALVVAGLTLAVPFVVWTAAWLLESAGRVPGVASSVGAVLLTYASTIAAIIWRHRAVLGRQASGLLNLRKSGGVPAAVPTSVLQRLLVIVTTGVLAAAWLVVFGGSATVLGEPGALVTAAVVAVVVFVLGGLFDVTSLSLHPFYRERVASAFAVRVVRRRRDRQVVAVPYDPAERTTLSAHGRLAEGVRFPEVVFAAAANLTGEARTPPGLGAVSYTLSAEWTGGPDVGWVRTADLEHAVTKRLRRDLTVQGAVAVSGAAFASAMGRDSRWFQVLFAVTGARLGAWLPNPGFVAHAQRAAERGDWAFPWLPKARRLPYLLREVFGVHPHSDRLVHVTDGGHYDNLGLVELLRRRCTRIVCVDATSDAPPTASTLAHALTLAHQELGVRVELDEPWETEPGTGEPWDGADALAGRLSRTPVITGTIVYPPESGVRPEVRGRLIVARALLWPELPYSLLSYALHHPEFPNDSTGDQWFDDGKFSAYTELGRRIGTKAREAASASVDQAGTHQPSPSGVVSVEQG